MVMNFKLFSSGVLDVFRTFSSKTGNKAFKSAQIGYKKRTKYKKKISCEPKIKWTEEQKEVLNYVRHGMSVFITGSAGTGKTVLLKHIINILKRANGSSGVAVTASTGIAACSIKGLTLHSFSGFGFCHDDDREGLLAKVSASNRASNRWMQAKALVIDEISMIDANMFDNLEYVARQIRGSNKVWGGLQLIVSGDFFQLPPVVKERDSLGKEFAFEAECWDASFDAQIEITKIFRQEDAELIRFLQGIRKGVIDAEDMKLVEQCCSSNKLDSSVVRLYPRVEDVDKVNKDRMKILGEKLVVYKAVDGGTRINYWKEVLKHGIAPDQLELCKGARVILIKNLHVWRKLCNGATGTVTGFVEPDKPDTDFINMCPDKLLPVVEFDSGEKIVIEPQKWEFFDGEVLVAWRSQLPLRLAYALSIHKCQGMTIDRLHTDISRCFGYGMVYVVLSRVRSLKGIHLSGFSPSMIKAHPKVLHFYEKLTGEQRTEEEDVNDVTYKKKVTNYKVLGHSDQTSTQGTNCRFSLKVYLSSYKQKK